MEGPEPDESVTEDDQASCPDRRTPPRGERDSQRPEVLAGLSPLTAVAPAARPPQRLTSLFWYDPGDGTPERPARWYDPGSAELSEDGTFRLPNPLTGKPLRRLLRAWLTKACESTANPTALSSFGLTPGDGKLLYNELRRWDAA